ncbi:hypothetical protein [Pandoraea sp.]|uniref:hypothetical protein n=1 Tax=Pandoraea sp. TaxID=1883445 RepID=UPI00121BC7F8|nr:hypothetical protein [Pandoraea sp.]TAL52750.1 MAG: hypothetical protein EPN80_17990 [Pandoraea sp.]TAM17728.1 MAG: hypothetical protein EPN65_09925 [Pandoraea sp.]
MSGQLTPRIGQVFTDGRATFVQFSGAPPAHLSVRGDAGALPYTRHGDLLVVSGEPASFQLTTSGGAVSIEREAPGRGSPIAASKDDAMDTMTQGTYRVDNNEDWVGVEHAPAVAPTPGAPRPPGQAVATPRASPLPP